MEPIAIAFAVTMAAAGAVTIWVGLSRQTPALDAGEYLKQLDSDGQPASEYERRLEEPFALRILHPVARALTAVTSLTPRSYIDKVHKKLLLAGISGSIRAEEFVVAHACAIGFLTIGSLAYSILGQPSARVGILILIFGPLIGTLAPSAWLTRKVDERQQAILKDLPDTLDLLAISVEAGMGFEGALDVVCKHFDSPLAEEFKRTLREMELGLPRREAFQNLKKRTEVPDLSNFVLAIMQADALGIPIGRVLKTQANEMRNKRRQWAREKAGKLPVKMLFPLMLLIFPSIMIVVLGPAGSNIVKALK